MILVLLRPFADDVHVLFDSIDLDVFVLWNVVDIDLAEVDGVFGEDMNCS